MKSNLPVILLRGIILLPHNELRLEFDNDISRNIIDVSELFHDNHLLVVSGNNPLEETANVNELPQIGVIAKISHKMELPNGKTRVIITGLKRALIHEYLNLNNENEVLESIVSNIEPEEIDPKEETAIIRKLYHELESYIKQIPYISNSILSKIINVKKVDTMTDIISPNLPVSLNRIYEYLNTQSSVKRAQMILEDIYQESELFDIEKKLDLKVREELDNSQKEYLLREKIRLIKQELGDTSLKENEIEKLKEKMNSIDFPIKIKERLTNEIKRYETLPPTSPEVNISRNYIDWLMDLPWNTYTIDNSNLKDVKMKLDKTHNGLDKIKTRIIEYLAVQKLSKNVNSPILCLIGPPGVGKTSLAFSIAKAMNRNFVKVSVGGVRDECEIIGHRRTYLGANPGRIIQSMKKAKSNNPVFLIDEIDKMSSDYKGDPASSLLSVLDFEQNKYFSDNYIEEDYDLSKVMFILTANYIEDIPEALKDRLEIIELSGYTEYEKLDIAKKHLIPKIIKEHGLKSETINFDDEVILKIIRSYTKEAGVRELERQLSTIIRKIVTSIVTNNIKFRTLNITVENLFSYLGKEKFRNSNIKKHPQIGVVNGLAYTKFGGDTLPIEVNYYEGKGDLVLTGSLGDVMKESAQIALSYIKSNYKYFKLDYNKIVHNDIHIHVPEGAVPKDGPSAGITLTTALISAVGNKKINQDIAMTGEITLRGQVLPIGGLKEKTLGAYRNNIKKIIIPYDNLNDLDEIPNEIKEKLEFIPVKNYREVYKILVKEN